MERIVLAADDDEDAQLLLRRAFEQAGVAVNLHLVGDGVEAIDYLQGNGRFAERTQFPLPDLLLLDLKMPRLSGFEVLEQLNSGEGKRSFKVAVFSSSENPGDVRRARELGCDAYLVKPADFKRLIDLARTIERDFLGANQQRELASLSVANVDDAIQAEESEAEIPVIDPVQTPEVFHLLVEQVKDYAIFVLDTAGHVRSWNEGARRIKGYEAHEIIGRHFSIFYPKQDLGADKPHFELQIAKEMGRYEEEGWRLRKDGSRFWASVVVTALRDRSGRLTGFAKVTRDLTQRKLQEEHVHRLLEAEERFRLLVDQVRDYAIFFLDARGHITSWNQGAHRIKGYTADEIIGKHFSVFYTPEDLAADKPSHELTIAIREGRYEEEGWRLKKDGSRFWASVVITSLWDKRGNLSGFGKVTRDLTLRKMEEEKLRARTEELEAFAHTLSHDLRAPVRSITSFSELMKEGGNLSEQELRTYADKINRSARLIDTLIREILKFSQVSLSPAPVEALSLEEVVADCLTLHQAQIEKTRANVHVRRPLPRVCVNRTLALQIFSNLLGNALKFTQPGTVPDIDIYARINDSECEVHLADKGVGIEERHQEEVFDLFNRGSAKHNEEGVGIGLAIVKRAVERAGGRITLDSKTGEGSDFIVTLPCNAPQLAVA